MSTKLNAGRLRHRVRIEQPIVSQDPTTGAVTEAWATVVTVYAAIEPLSAREFVTAQSTQSQIAARIVIRYRPGMTANMRLIDETSGTIYNPAGFLADPVTGRDYLTIPCSVEA